jgi:hypothetical protein
LRLLEGSRLTEHNLTLTRITGLGTNSLAYKATFYFLFNVQVEEFHAYQHD